MNKHQDPGASRIDPEDIGRRLHAFRIGAGLSPEDLAEQTGVSRAAIYRYEAGNPPRVDTLGKIAVRLGVSLPTLLGVGTEYVPTALGFFERMRQLEEEVEVMRVLFGPTSYLLTTSGFDALLPKVLGESIPEDVPNRVADLATIDELTSVLLQRKAIFAKRRPEIISLMSAAELQQFVRNGFIGAFDAPGMDIGQRHRAARLEIENIVRLLRDPPIGVQLGLIIDSIPGASFQIFRQGDETRVAVSPFRLGALANIRLGVATITADPDAIRLYNEMTDRLWLRCLKGNDAADFIQNRILSKS